MLVNLNKHAFTTLWTALAMILGMIAGIVATLTWLAPGPGASSRELPLYASATDRGDSIAAATGLIDENTEGLFILDYKSGRLTLDVLNYLDGTEMGGRFVRANVHADLKVEADKPSYLLLTGETKFGGGRVGAADPSRCVVYVIDQHSGRWVAYGLLWNTGAAKLGRYQSGELKPVRAGNARPEELQQ